MKTNIINQYVKYILEPIDNFIKECEATYQVSPNERIKEQIDKLLKLQLDYYNKFSELIESEYKEIEKIRNLVNS